MTTSRSPSGTARATKTATRSRPNASLERLVRNATLVKRVEISCAVRTESGAGAGVWCETQFVFFPLSRSLSLFAVTSAWPAFHIHKHGARLARGGGYRAWAAAALFPRLVAARPSRTRTRFHSGSALPGSRFKQQQTQFLKGLKRSNQVLWSWRH